MLEDRHFTHDVDCTVCGRARLAVEIIDEAWRPVRTGDREHQRGFVRIAALRETEKRVIGHRHLALLMPSAADAAAATRARPDGRPDRADVRRAAARPADRAARSGARYPRA